MKILYSKLTLTLVLLLSTINYASAFNVDGINYRIINESNVAVTESEYHGDLVIPSSITNDGNTYSVIGIDPYSFFNCTMLTSVTIPSSVSVIGEGAFYYCSELAKVNIPENIEELLNGTFYYCLKLENMPLPKNLESIGGYCFYGCQKFTNVDALAESSTPWFRPLVQPYHPLDIWDG